MKKFNVSLIFLFSIIFCMATNVSAEISKNLKTETFKTSLLFWDQRAHRIYSPAYMEIDGETRKLSGYNFSSNEQMTDYIIHSSKGQFPLEDNAPTPQPDPAIMAEQNNTEENGNTE